MYTEIKDGKRVLKSKIKLKNDFENVLKEYKFKEYSQDIWNNEETETLIEIHKDNKGTVCGIEVRNNTLDLSYYKNEKYIWVSNDGFTTEIVGRYDNSVIDHIMGIIRLSWKKV